MTKQLRLRNSLFLIVLAGLTSFCRAETGGGKPLIVAHYMSWFALPDKSGGWGNWKFSMDGVSVDKHHYPDLILPNGRRDIAAVHYPVIGPYDSTDPAALEYHILLAQEAGIDSFMVNWYGFEDDKGNQKLEDRGLERLIKVAERLNFKVCINLDDKCLFPPFYNTKSRAEALALLKKTLQKIMQKYASSPAYLRIDGRPVISNFGWSYATTNELKQASFSVKEWKEAAETLKEGRFYFIHDHQWHWRKSIEEAGFISFADSIFSWIGQSADRIEFFRESRKLVKEGKMKMVTGHANPGFDNTPCWGWGGGINKIPRRNGEEFREEMEESIQNGAGFIQLITWNDFTEGSTIEPTEEYGYQYLKITSDFANRWAKGSPYGKSFDLPKKIFEMRSRAERLEASRLISPENLSPIQENMKKIVDSFIAHDRAAAEGLIEKNRNFIEAEEKKLPKIKKMDVSLSPPSVEVFGGDTVELALEIINPYSEKVPVYVEMDRYGIPKSWLGELEKTVWLKPMEKVTLPFQIKIPIDARDTIGWFTAAVDSPYAPVTSNVAYVRVFENSLKAEIGPVNLLRPDRKEELTLNLDVRQKRAMTASISFSVPKKWKVKPESVSQDLPKKGSLAVPFTLEIPSDVQSTGTLTVAIRYGNLERVVREPFGAIPAGKAVLLEGDINQDDLPDFVLGNDAVEFQCTSAIGARIFSFIYRPTMHNQLFLDYPRVARTEGDAWEKWAEYGGINDIFPEDWPGMIWNNSWDYRITGRGGDEVSVVMSSKVKGTLSIQREIALRANASSAKLKYELRNLGAEAKDVFWSNHPDLMPGGGAGSEDLIIVSLPRKTPEKEELAENNFFPRLQKMHYVPSEDWILAYDSNNREYFGQVFDRSLVEKIGIWEGKTFFTMEIILKKIRLNPGEKKSFTVDYLIGQNSKDAAIKKLRNKE